MNASERLRVKDYDFIPLCGAQRRKNSLGLVLQYVKLDVVLNISSRCSVCLFGEVEVYLTCAKKEIHTCSRLAIIRPCLKKLYP